MTKVPDVEELNHPEQFRFGIFSQNNYKWNDLSRFELVECMAAPAVGLGEQDALMRKSSGTRGTVCKHLRSALKRQKGLLTMFFQGFGDEDS